MFLSNFHITIFRTVWPRDSWWQFFITSVLSLSWRRYWIYWNAWLIINIKLKVPLLVVSSVIYPHFLESIFYLQIVPIVPTKFRVIWPFISGEEVQKGFSRWRPRWSSCILDQNNFNFFWFTSSSDTSYQVLIQLAFPFKRRSSK